MANSQIAREVGKAALRIIGRKCHVCHRMRKAEEWTVPKRNRCDECEAKRSKPKPK